MTLGIHLYFVPSIRLHPPFPRGFFIQDKSLVWIYLDKFSTFIRFLSNNLFHWHHLRPKTWNPSCLNIETNIDWNNRCEDVFIGCNYKRNYIFSPSNRFHKEELIFYLIASPPHIIVIGVSCLETHNPVVNWSNHSITFRQKTHRIEGKKISTLQHRKIVFWSHILPF